MTKIALLLLVVITFFACQDKPDTKVFSIDEALTNHLNDWYPRILDTIDGGYYSNFEYDWQQGQVQNKMLVTQARGLWTAAKASQYFPEDIRFAEAAKHGFLFLTENMWDNKSGGFHTNFPAKANRSKLSYANSFALFALAEYARINPSVEVLHWMDKTFFWLDSVAHDDQYGGYYNVIKNNKIPDQKNSSTAMGDLNPKYKDQNTSIHILEALTLAYQVNPTSAYRKRLEEMLFLIRDKMTSNEGSLHLYFTPDWKAINHADSSRSFILKNILLDNISFGHDIETAYLLIDAAKALYGKVDPQTFKVAKNLTDHTLKYGFDENYFGLFYTGYRFNEEVEIVDQVKSWWAQFEALHTLKLMQFYFPEEEIYTRAYEQMWIYINQFIIDHNNGGHFESGWDNMDSAKKARKAHQWKGAYHDGRALMLIREYNLQKE